MSTSIFPAVLNTRVESGVRIIGLLGPSGCGKTLAAKVLQNTYKDVYAIALADPLKKAAAIILDVSEEMFHDQELKAAPIPKWEDIRARAFAQVFGTEVGRAIHPDIWIKHATNHLNGKDEGQYIYDPTDTVVIHDIRFQNEYDWVVANKGIIVSIERDNLPSPPGGISGHPSERMSSINLHAKGQTYVIANNGTIPEFKRAITKLFIDCLIPL